VRALGNPRPLLDHVIGPRDHRFRDREAERFGGLQINHEAEPARLLEWQVGGLGAFQDTVDERCGSFSDLAAARLTKCPSTALNSY